MNLKEAIETVAFELGELPCMSDEAYDALDYIENNADNIVEVVRCKDCKWHRIEHICTLHEIEIIYLDWFCADGERKDGWKPGEPDAGMD